MKGMKFSIHTLVQALIVIVGGIIDIYDLVPVSVQKKLLIVCMVSASLLGLYHQFVNPDGTNATAPWQKKLDNMKKKAGILSVLVLGLFMIPEHAIAQTGQGFSLGVAYDQNAVPGISGWTAYDHEVYANIYSYSGFDAYPVKVEGQTIPKFKFTPFTGFAYRFLQSGRVDVFTFVAGGLSTTGETTTGAGKLGGFGHIDIGKGFGALIGAEGTYSPIDGYDFVFRTGMRFGLGR